MPGAVSGVFRGVCVDSRDPLGIGRIRVLVPQVLGDRASGWAFPAWSLHDLTVWPQDRVPDPGTGVWVLFEGPDRLTWMSVFGPVEESLQALDLQEGSYSSSVAIDVPWFPMGIPAPVRGSLTSPAGVPGPGTVVVLQRSPSEDGPWEDLEEFAVDYLDGSFDGYHDSPDGDPSMWYRAHFEGLPPWTRASSLPVRQDVPERPTSLTWSTGRDPRWLVQEAMSGSLSWSGGPVRGMLVHLYVSSGGHPWEQVASSAPTSPSGSWSLSWTRPEGMHGPFRARAVFLGSGEYGFSQDPATFLSIPAMEAPTVSSWSFPDVLMLGAQVPVSGTVRPQDPVHGTPRPSAEILLEMRTPSIQTPPEGPWSVIARVPLRENGSWSGAFPSAPASADYRATSSAPAPFLPSTSPERTVVLALRTTTSMPSSPSGPVFGSGFVSTGTVRDEVGRAVGVGTVEVDHRTGSVPGSMWALSGSASVSMSGAYQVTVPGLQMTGPVQARARYLGVPSAGFLPSESVGTSSFMVGLTAPVVSRGTVGATSAVVSWVPVPGAQSYLVRVSEGTTAEHSTSATSFSVPLPHRDRNYTISVLAERRDPAGNLVRSAASASIRAFSGRPESRRTNTFDYSTNALATGSWRSAPGGGSWNPFIVALMQGRPGTGEWYRGVASFDGAAFRRWITDNHGGEQTLSHITWTYCAMLLTRNSTSGNGAGAVTPRWYVTDSTPGVGGLPVLIGGEDSPDSVGLGASAWCRVPSPWWAGHVLLNQVVANRTIRSFGLARDVDGSYMAAVGTVTLRVLGSYDYIVVSGLPPRWL